MQIQISLATAECVNALKFVPHYCLFTWKNGEKGGISIIVCYHNL